MVYGCILAVEFFVAILSYFFGNTKNFSQRLKILNVNVFLSTIYNQGCLFLIFGKDEIYVNIFKNVETGIGAILCY